MRKKRITRKLYTQPEVDLIKEMIADGKSNTQIAKATGRTAHAIEVMANRILNGYTVSTKRRGARGTQVSFTPNVLWPVTEVAITPDTAEIDLTFISELVASEKLSKAQKLKVLQALL